MGIAVVKLQDTHTAGRGDKGAPGADSEYVRGLTYGGASKTKLLWPTVPLLGVQLKGMKRDGTPASRGIRHSSRDAGAP